MFFKPRFLGGFYWKRKAIQFFLRELIKSLVCFSVESNVIKEYPYFLIKVSVLFCNNYPFTSEALLINFIDTLISLLGWPYI